MIPKFRAWDKENRTMLTWEQLKSEADFSWFADENLVFMQSTGLKDKSGVDVYEGDIIRSIYGDCSAIGIGKYIREYQEEFDDYPRVYTPTGVYEYMLNDSTGGKLPYGFELSGAESSEVVGNIYQNHELLEVEVTDVDIYNRSR